MTVFIQKEPGLYVQLQGTNLPEDTVKAIESKIKEKVTEEIRRVRESITNQKDSLEAQIKEPIISLREVNISKEDTLRVESLIRKTLDEELEKIRYRGPRNSTIKLYVHTEPPGEWIARHLIGQLNGGEASRLRFGDKINAVEENGDPWNVQPDQSLGN